MKNHRFLSKSVVFWGAETRGSVSLRLFFGVARRFLALTNVGISIGAGNASFSPPEAKSKQQHQEKNRKNYPSSCFGSSPIMGISERPYKLKADRKQRNSGHLSKNSQDHAACLSRAEVKLPYVKRNAEEIRPLSQ